MAVTTTSSKTASIFVAKLAADYPQFTFKPGNQEHWSPKTKTITYEAGSTADNLRYGLLHELAHALLDHDSYHSDFELLKLESLAWQKAAQVGKKYGINIDEEHIQNCLDTYRDWLHRRSKCPTCGMHVLQKDAKTYNCFNCGASWQVSSGRFARSYRRRT
jgi:predicted RNA-binding Zn-ribbon protein involved in translation (DUF1610 family)